MPATLPHIIWSPLGKLIDLLLKADLLKLLQKAWAAIRTKLHPRSPTGMYEVLEYESTLELLDAKGQRATFRKREKVRYLQDNVIAYRDQAWGDGEILLQHRCTPDTRAITSGCCASAR
jgi:hypothetical protein